MLNLLNAAVLQQDQNDQQTAIVFIQPNEPDITVTRAEFRTTVQQYATNLAQRGLQTGQLILIADTQSLASIYTFWGAIWLGAIPTLFPTQTEKLDPAVYNQRMSKLIHLSSVDMVITDSSFANTLAQTLGRNSCPIHTTSDLQQVPAQNIASYQATETENEIALLQHSSGTTGLQKGVALTHTAVVQQLHEYGRAIQLSPQDKVVSWLPLYHDMGLIAGFLLPLFHGIPLILMSPFAWVRSPAMLLKAINDYQGTLCWLPNFAYNHCARRIRRRDFEALSLTSMRLFINCSEPVRATSHHLFLDKFASIGATAAQLGVSYAMAENTFAVSQTDPNQPAKQDIVDGRILAEEKRAVPIEPNSPHAVVHVSCGAPLPQTAVRVLDPSNQPLTERHVGQIAIKSPYMLRDYYKRPELKPFDTDGWYRTGDMGYIAAGEIYIIGRQKDLIINAGKNVYPQYIESILNNTEGVHAGRVVVFGIPDERDGTELLVALAEATTADPDEKREIGRLMRQAVAQQSMVTLSYAQIVPPRWLIKTSSGKIGRDANRTKWLAEKSTR